MTVKEIREKIREAAYSRFPGASAQKERWEASGGNWWPDKDSAYAEMIKAEEASDEAWEQTAAEMAASAEYAEVVAKFGYDEVVEQIRGWYRSAEEIKEELGMIAAAAAEREAAAAEREAAAAWAQRLTDALERIEQIAAGVRKLPSDASDVFGHTSKSDFGEYPARWKTSSSSNIADGYLNDGEGGQFYVGGVSSAPSKRSTRLEFRPDWAERWEQIVKNVGDEGALNAFTADIAAALTKEQREATEAIRLERMEREKQEQEAERLEFLELVADEAVTFRQSNNFILAYNRDGGQIGMCRPCDKVAGYLDSIGLAIADIIG